jgi:hypothetical protein
MLLNALPPPTHHTSLPLSLSVPTIMKYLIAINNTVSAEVAFQKVVNIINKDEDLLFFVVVIPKKVTHKDSAEKQRKKAKLRTQANALAASYRERAQQLGIRQTGTVLAGDAREVLLYVRPSSNHPPIAGVQVRVLPNEFGVGC